MTAPQALRPPWGASYDLPPHLSQFGGMSGIAGVSMPRQRRSSGSFYRTANDPFGLDPLRQALPIDPSLDNLHESLRSLAIPTPPWGSGDPPVLHRSTVQYTTTTAGLNTGLPDPLDVGTAGSYLPSRQQSPQLSPDINDVEPMSSRAWSTQATIASQPSSASFSSPNTSYANSGPDGHRLSRSNSAFSSSSSRTPPPPYATHEPRAEKRVRFAVPDDPTESEMEEIRSQSIAESLASRLDQSGPSPRPDYLSSPGVSSYSAHAPYAAAASPSAGRRRHSMSSTPSSSTREPRSGGYSWADAHAYDRRSQPHWSQNRDYGSPMASGSTGVPKGYYSNDWRGGSGWQRTCQQLFPVFVRNLCAALDVHFEKYGVPNAERLRRETFHDRRLGALLDWSGSTLFRFALRSVILASSYSFCVSLRMESQIRESVYGCSKEAPSGGKNQLKQIAVSVFQGDQKCSKPQTS